VKISIDHALLKAKSHAKKGEIEEARQLFQSVLQAFPKNVRAQQGLAALSKPKQNEAPQAVHQEVINRLVALYNQGQLSAVVEQARALTEQYPGAFFVWNVLGAAYKGLGRTEDAASAFKRVTELDPTYADGFSNLGATLKAQGKLDEAIAAYNKALSIKPDHADAYNNMGNALQEQGKLDEAIAAYNKALSIKPDYADAYYNMGAALQEQGKLDEAIAAYNKVLSIKPDHADAYNNMGNALKAQGKLDEAIAAYNKALSIKPDYAEAYNNMGNALKAQGKLDEAIAAYNKALSIKPDYAAARAQCLHQLAHICDWSAVEANQYYLLDLGIKGEAVPTFTMLSLEDAPDRHRLRSVNFVREQYPQKAIVLPAKPAEQPERLRIGYFSADFYNHATMYLMAQIFAAHDKSRFEIFAYSYGPDKQDEMRKKLVSAVDVFHGVREMNDMQIVELARAEKVDIAVDLKGFTTSARLAPFAYGLAPVQISYLGYPGTIGADFIDYIVADSVVIPDNKRQYYSEKVIYLPNTYQPTDNTRVISDKVIKREDMGLPSKGFVFCCFNNNYKISPTEFDIWMRLLGKVENSVLWLLKSNKWAEPNLKREAEARGISAERLIFAEKVPQAEHLARQKLADLFLDTFNCNAHTTTSDALWAGLPVVTKLGEGFAARVAGSLLAAVGLPELITESEEAYEALALMLATDSKQLGQFKLKLDRNRLTQPLFDSEMYTRHLEAGYQMAYDQYFNEQERSDIVVPK
jgi:predicted O-linked N-acetylglucosamine transferase (SPINDLY family)